MDKQQLIERITTEALIAAYKSVFGREETSLDALSSDEKRFMNKVVSFAIERIDAERGKDAVAWMSPGKERIEFSRADTVYGSHTLPLFLSPTIPEGMALVPTNEIKSVKVHSDFKVIIQVTTCRAACEIKARIAAAQGERNV